jgi:hypothetical protein
VEEYVTLTSEIAVTCMVENLMERTVLRFNVSSRSSRQSITAIWWSAAYLRSNKHASHRKHYALLT